MMRHLMLSQLANKRCAVLEARAAAASAVDPARGAPSMTRFSPDSRAANGDAASSPASSDVGSPTRSSRSAQAIVFASADFHTGSAYGLDKLGQAILLPGKAGACSTLCTPVQEARLLVSAIAGDLCVGCRRPTGDSKDVKLPQRPAAFGCHQSPSEPDMQQLPPRNCTLGRRRTARCLKPDPMLTLDDWTAQEPLNPPV